MPGNGDFDFTIGQKHRKYGDVLDIFETHEVLTYDASSYPSSYNCVVKVVFATEEIVLQANNPLMVVYRKEEKK